MLHARDLVCKIGGFLFILLKCCFPSGAEIVSPLAHDFSKVFTHTVWDEPGGTANRSGAGDLDVVIYSARKWCRLALAGNPTVLLVLFVPDEEIVFRNEASQLLSKVGSISCRLP